MGLYFGLQLEQKQQLIMTPELRQAIEILQLPSFELNQLIEQELQKNPMIDLIEEQFTNEELDKESQEDTKEIDWEKYFDHNDTYYGGQREVNDQEYNQENYVKHSITLKEHLQFQLHISVVKPKYKKIGEYIIECIDNNGYLTVDIEEIAQILNEKLSDVENILYLIQSFDPSGVGARNLRECLSIQLKQMNYWDERMKKIIYNHLEDLANNRFQRISKKLGISCKEIQDIKDFIKTLEPKPGRIFATDQDVRYIIPDAYIKKIGDEYLVIINDSANPRLRINHFYKTLLKQEDKSSLTSKYLKEKLESAMWLIKSIEQRRSTLYNVVSSILEVQKDFFEQGVTALKPLTLKEIAEKLEIHESTVSRATNGKYVQTPKGLFELKYFFNSGIESKSGDMMASQGIKNMIKEIIEREDSSKPISDQKIADILKDKGIKISRRTVAKYRDEMGILSSSKRKRYV
ncbi:RNA polymerase factor sigma-54 [Garciella nitratireducens]|uniref:RNA polymerase, sigma 54 subunit, RpoN/SigL n=1 Tax=Garciella nitratireducens DSM 15102 TaxID=1121911 RepID=A0A1T4KL33_9FIRM|nr:RNA polymerase factor sigma-54 [Garciella nitratireducens]SJZ43077.1 RNA polymerase, sigma 54 subunit, RpoN/SigL [Garciella nitratireducens DSM 15102]